MTTVKTGQPWERKTISYDRPTWVVVSVSPDGTVALTGPGPCRMMKYLSIDELEAGWQPVLYDPQEFISLDTIELPSTIDIEDSD